MPEYMKAIRLLNHSAPLQIQDLPVPVPQPGELLIKVSCAPVNPADRMQIAGTYVDVPELPYTPGLCAVGHVIGGEKPDMMGQFLKGKRIVFSPGMGRNGTWAQYAVAPPGYCVPLDNSLSDTDGVNLIANAMTALGLIERAGRLGAKAIVLTGAGGEVGKLINAATDIPVINIVRSIDTAKNFAVSGKSSVLAQEQDNFQEALGAEISRFEANVAIDAVAGTMTETLLGSLPDYATVIVYGRLSGEDVSFDGLRYLVGKHQKLVGFNINEWLTSKSLPSVLMLSRKASRLLANGHGTRVKDRVGLEELVEGFEALGQNQALGKTILFPNGQE